MVQHEKTTPESSGKHRAIKHNSPVGGKETMVAWRKNIVVSTQPAVVPLYFLYNLRMSLFDLKKKKNSRYVNISHEKDLQRVTTWL